MIRSNRRSGCKRFAADLAGYSDQSLSLTRTEAVGQHLVDCPQCMAEVDCLIQIRTMLASAKPTTTSSDLESRLLAIAGTQRSAPLWLADGESELPSRRQRRHQLMKIVISGGTVAMIFVLAMALLIAPNGKIIEDPTGPAKQDFTASLAALGLHDSAVAVMIAEGRGAQLNHVSQIPTQPVEGAAKRVSANEALRLLNKLRRASTAASGMQRVYLSQGKKTISANVRVRETTNDGVAMNVLTTDGKTFPASVLTDQDIWYQTKFNNKYEYFSYGQQVTVAGHHATVLEARNSDRLVARWWFDLTEPLLLWAEHYDLLGKPVISVGYEVIEDLEESAPPPVHQQLANIAVKNRPVQPTEQWCIGWHSCPLAIGGLPLVAYSVEGKIKPNMHLVYSDGIQVITVVRTPGFLNHPMTKVKEFGIPRVRCWQSGTAVVSVATSGSEALLDLAEAALPTEKPVKPDLGWRISSGLKRLVGASNN